jgi:hypothetical protein
MAQLRQWRIVFTSEGLFVVSKILKKKVSTKSCVGFVLQPLLTLTFSKIALQQNRADNKTIDGRQAKRTKGKRRPKKGKKAIHIILDLIFLACFFCFQQDLVQLCLI